MFYSSILFSSKICLFASQSQRGRHRKKNLFHSLLHSSSVDNGQNCSGLKPWARNSIWVSHMGSRVPCTWVMCWGFPSLLSLTALLILGFHVSGNMHICVCVADLCIHWVPEMVYSLTIKGKWPYCVPIVISLSSSITLIKKHYRNMDFLMNCVLGIIA